MIDCENEVYTRLATVLRESFPEINIAGEYVRSPSSFPHASIVMADNFPLEGRLDSSGEENLSVVFFEINVYSNKTQGKKTECKTIMNLIDKELYAMNFKRTVLTPVPNLEDATIYRLTARYRAVTDGTFFYRRSTE